MYRRLLILSVIIVIALCGLSWLGYRAISMWAQGIEGTRISEFADVADQIRLDVNDKFDTFMEQEMQRPYTDYQYYTNYMIAEEPLPANQEMQTSQAGTRNDINYNNANQAVREQQANTFNNSNQMAVMRSPLADDIEHGLAYFNFQIDEENNSIISPNGNVDQQQLISSTEKYRKLNKLVETNSKYVRDNVLPALEKLESEKLVAELKKEVTDQKDLKADVALDIDSDSELGKKPKSSAVVTEEKDAINLKPGNSKGLSSNNRTQSFNIGSFEKQNNEPLVQTQPRNFVMNNTAQNDWVDSAQQTNNIEQYQDLEKQQLQASDEKRMPSQQQAGISVQNEPQQIPQQSSRSTITGGFGGGRMQSAQDRASNAQTGAFLESNESGLVRDSGTLYYQRRAENQMTDAIQNQADVVEVTIDGFKQVLVPDKDNKDSIFGVRVFMIRRVKFEGKELIQGFQLNEKKLLEEVEESTKRFVREGMSYELGRKQNASSAYTAILDFGFGHLLLNLFENNPGRIAMQINHLRIWYFSIISVVFLAVILAVISLWLNAREQITLAQKKDDFVSAVSHELRTPLTSIRMHAEMLEKNWIKSENKLGEYYRSMRQESERLSRLIENVLDFSRIQKGRKKYVFKLGDINKCVAGVVEMMTAYAAQKGFQIQTQLGKCREISFDSDAVTQIVVNLLDNAIKYSGGSQDKTITVRTGSDDEFVLIEIEDHGPGIPHSQRKRIFQEFYRIGAESTRETAGSGLGLALVKKFAQAHNGFVEILNARPTGAIFRVSLATKHLEGI